MALRFFSVVFFYTIVEFSLSSRENTFVVDCRSVTGPKTANHNDATSSVGCANDEVLVSCGYKTEENVLDTFSDGAYARSDNKCEARNGHYNTDGVYPVGRCCPDKYFSGCQTVQSAQSGDKNDDETTATCPSGTILTGCSAYTGYHNVDGARPTITVSENSCTARRSETGAGNGQGLWAYARCCTVKTEEYQVTCKVKEPANPSSPQAGAYSTIQCDKEAGETLFGCTGMGGWHSLGGYFIDETGTDTCKARNSAERDAQYKAITASAICCTTESTLSPKEECLIDCNDGCYSNSEGKSRCIERCNELSDGAAAVMSDDNVDGESKFTDIITANWINLIGFLVLFVLSLMTVVLFCRFSWNKSAVYKTVTQDDFTTSAVDESKRLNM